MKFLFLQKFCVAQYAQYTKDVLSKNINSLINLLANKVLHNRGFKSKHGCKIVWFWVIFLKISHKYHLHFCFIHPNFAKFCDIPLYTVNSIFMTRFHDSAHNNNQSHFQRTICSNLHKAWIKCEKNLFHCKPSKKRLCTERHQKTIRNTSHSLLPSAMYFSEKNRI